MNNTSTSRVPIYSLYVLKAICAFIVVACHTRMEIFDRMLSGIDMSAVPIFYMISGYFIYTDNLQTMVDRMKKTSIKLLWLILSLNALYYLVVFVNHGNVVKTLPELLNWIFQGGVITGHLWYLTAFAEATLFFWLFLSVFKGRYLSILPVLLLSGALGAKYAVLLGGTETLYPVFTVYAYAIPYLALGFLIKKNEEKLALNSYLLFAFVILSILLCVAEEKLLLTAISSGGNIGPLLSTPLISISCFLLALRHKDFGKNSFAVTVGEKYSGQIYYFHILIATGLGILFSLLGIRPFYEANATVLAFIGSLLFAMLLSYIQDKWNILKWLK